MDQVLRVHPETLRQYALLADGERGALIGPRGDIAFLCAPKWHDDAVFSDLIGGRGNYVLRPTDERFVWGGNYESGSLIWRTRWVVGPDVVESREALAFPGERSCVVLLRRIEAVRGSAEVRVLLDCRAGFGSEQMNLRGCGDGAWEGRSGALHLRWNGVSNDATVRPDGAVEVRIRVPEGGHHDLVLEIGFNAPEGELPDADRLWRRTEDAWSRAVPEGRESIAPRDVAHSWAVLRGLTTADGAMVAAATTSLPERSDAGRDYDYRYAWIRDQCFAGHAVAAAGGGDLLDHAVGFVRDRLLQDGEHLVPAYTRRRGPGATPAELDLAGYPGAPGAYVGNHVRDQFQLDAFGEALLLLASADRLGRLDADGWRAADAAVTGIAHRWR